MPAKAARRHLATLSRAGVGRNAVCDATGIPRSTIAKIKSGKRSQIRKSTERKILAVDTDARADASIVPAKRTWRLINGLLSEGFTKADIAKRLGYKTLALQIKKDFVLARTEVAVERLYGRLMS